MALMQEKYQMFARKYRPQTFSDVVGQEAIVKTLKNSLKYNKSAQAYLFAGPRGIGKTTLTRLLAKALNCQKLSIDLEPCNLCQSCLEISLSSSLDVIEIDGASNRGIDDIRQINETVGYAPSSGKYKIYIIDEVHMLTKEAFNALLKTLEEPPPTIKFFFATTEPHKVLPTILSRCQRFDLKPINQSLIINKLKEIAEDQHRDISLDALKQIAKLSEGSLRDGESMLDQILCYSEKQITEEMINQIFGLIPQEYFFEIDNAVKEGEIKTALKIADILYKEGKDCSFFIDSLIDHFRKIIIIKLDAEADVFTTDSIKERYAETMKIYSLDQCLYILDFLMKSYLQLQKTSSKRSFLEMILIEIIRSQSKIPIQVLVQRLTSLEKSLKELDSLPKTCSSMPLDNLTEKISASPSPPTLEKEFSDSKVEENTDSSSTFPSLNAISLPSRSENKKILLEAVPFDLSDNPSPSTSSDQKSSYHHDTILNFAAVEMNGNVKKD